MHLHELLIGKGGVKDDYRWNHWMWILGTESG
jgi:hypothetical protein